MQTYHVSGMTCEHCRKAVTGAIQARDPQARVLVDLDAGTVVVEGSLSGEQVREAIREEGYQVQ